MTRTTTQPSGLTWQLNSPLALEAYLATLEQEQAYRNSIEDTLARLRQQLGLSASTSLPSAAEIRAMFARREGTPPPSEQLISDLVAAMREE